MDFVVRDEPGFAGCPVSKIIEFSGRRFQAAAGVDGVELVEWMGEGLEAYPRKAGFFRTMMDAVKALRIYAEEC